MRHCTKYLLKGCIRWEQWVSESVAIQPSHLAFLHTISTLTIYRSFKTARQNDPF